MENGYYYDNDFLSGDVCGIGAQYSIYKHSFYREEDALKNNNNSKSGTIFHNDAFTESVLSFLTPHVENIVGQKLAPTYSHLRNWMSGESERRKIQTNGADICGKIVLGYDYKGVDDSYVWGQFIDPTPNPLNPEWASNNNKGDFVEQNVGGLLLFECENYEHWKEPLLATEGSYQVEMVAYWVYDNGTKDHLKFDGRKTLGERKIVKYK